MKKTLLLITALLAGLTGSHAISNNTVEIVYSGTTATVTVAPNIQSYVTLMSGTSSHVQLVQAASFAGVNITASNTTGEITYVLSGSSADGEFYLDGSYKCTVELNGLTLTNPAGPAINLQNGKRIELSAKSGTVNTLADGANDTYNGTLHCKGHLKLKGKGTLNVTGNSRHGVYSKEYCEVKNLTLNITGAVKDGLHCKEYFLMESGTLSISGVQDDAIQVEVSDVTAKTGITTDHEDEDSGNFYQEGGAITLSNYQGKAVKTDGTLTLSGGSRNFTVADCEENALADGISTVDAELDADADKVYTLGGRQLPAGSKLQPGIYVVSRDGHLVKTVVK